MALTSLQRLDTYRFFSIAFGASPGTTYYGQMEEAYAAGLTTKQIVNIFTTKWQFQQAYAPTLSTTDFANLIVENVVAASATDSAKTAAKKDIVDAIGIGWSRGDIIYQLFSNLASKSADDSTWGGTSKLMQNRVDVAQYATEILGMNSTDLITIQNVIKGVTMSTDTSTTDAIKSALTTAGVSTSLAAVALTNGNDTYAAPAGTAAVAVNGGIGNDTITGADGNDQLYGGSGNDTIKGGKGKDYIEGGDGADTIKLGLYDSSSYVSSYYDTKGTYHQGYYVYSVDANPEIADGGAGADYVYGGYGCDTIYGGDGADNLYGEEYGYTDFSGYTFDDTATAGRLFNDTIYGGGGDDYLHGYYGDDRLFGGDGNDTIYGGYGDDYVEGGNGADNLYDYNGVVTLLAGAGDDYASATIDSAVKSSFIDLGEGVDTLSATVNTSGVTLKIVAGEDADVINLTSYTDATVNIDLTETVSAKDTINEPTYSNGNKPLAPAVVTGFNPVVDKLNVGYFNAYGRTNGAYLGVDFYQNTTTGAVTYYTNYVQKVSSPTDAFKVTGTGQDTYGKGVFVITGATAASTDLATVAAFLDPYGNNATYGNRASHIFVFNVKDQGVAAYRFTDDTGADSKIVADELMPLVVLTGQTTEDMDTNAYTFFIS